ncbi:MAG: hypothetical protein KJO07_18435, partial [Deltaproteobacteria bacterium]|nr:hypothetical protein [Deltaproteobacteria bacterium]
MGRKAVGVAGLVAMLGLAACALPNGDGGELTTVGVSCEVQADLYPNTRRPLDLLVVIDDSPAMQPYLDQVDEFMADLGRVLDNLERRPSVHLAVISADPEQGGRFQRGDACSLAPAFAVRTQPPWWQCDSPGCGYRNFEGELPDAASCLGALPLGDTAEPQPLAMALSAVDGTAPD